jgi:hypothetical protein
MHRGFRELSLLKEQAFRFIQLVVRLALVVQVIKGLGTSVGTLLMFHVGMTSRLLTPATWAQTP